MKRTLFYEQRLRLQYYSSQKGGRLRLGIKVLCQIVYLVECVSCIKYTSSLQQD
jgi:hypothetical protein